MVSAIYRLLANNFEWHKNMFIIFYWIKEEAKSIIWGYLSYIKALPYLEKKNEKH